MKAAYTVVLPVNLSLLLDVGCWLPQPLSSLLVQCMLAPPRRLWKEAARPPSSRGPPLPPETGFEGRSGYDPLYVAQRLALAHASAPPSPRRWPGSSGGSQPQHPANHTPLRSGGNNSGSLLRHTGADHDHRAPPHRPLHYPCEQYSYRGPLPPQLQVLSHPAPPQQPDIQQLQLGMPRPPPLQYWASNPRQRYQHAINQPMLAPRPSPQPPGGMPHPMHAASDDPVNYRPCDNHRRASHPANRRHRPRSSGSHGGPSCCGPGGASRCCPGRTGGPLCGRHWRPARPVPERACGLR